MVRLSPALLAALLLVAPTLARADVPAEKAPHEIWYRFRVDGIGKLSPDHVIVVYPLSTSNGAPTRELTDAQDGQWLEVDRSISPALYVVRKADYEAFAKDRLSGEVPNIDGLLAKAAKCNLAPSADLRSPDDEPPKPLEEVFVAQTINDTSCVLAKGRVGTPPIAPRKEGGCAGCAVGDNRVASGIGLSGLLVGLVALARRRPRR